MVKNSYDVYIPMSNKVVWELLGSLMIKMLDKLGDSKVVTEVEHYKENHPLTLYVEKYLRKLFAPNGGLSCPELAKRIEEFRKRNPKELEDVIRALVKEYCSKVISKEFRYELGERRSLRRDLLLTYV